MQSATRCKVTTGTIHVPQVGVGNFCNLGLLQRYLIDFLRMVSFLHNNLPVFTQMKITPMRTIFAVALVFFSNLSYANFIIEVDLSDPTAAVFSTTSAFADATLDDTAFNGITLTGFFGGNTTEVNFLNTSSGSINVFNAPDASSRFSLASWFVGVFTGGWTLNDLNFFDNTAPDLLYFFNDQIALTGSATLDLSSLLALPAVGTTGNVIIGAPDSGLVVGQWAIVGDASDVPAPNPLLLVVTGLLMLGRSRQNKT